MSWALAHHVANTCGLSSKCNGWPIVGVQGVVAPLAGFDKTFKRLVPVMPREGETPHVLRRQRPRPEIHRGLGRLFRIHVQVRPARVVLAGVERHPVERAVPLPDRGEVVAIARVTAEEDPPLRRLHGEPTHSDLLRVNVRPE